jgi:hypothetical protein
LKKLLFAFSEIKCVATSDADQMLCFHIS